MMWGNYSMGYWGWGVGALAIAAVIVAGILLFRFTSRQHIAPRAAAEPGAVTSQQILDGRLANGELSIKEYQDRLAALKLSKG